MTKKSADAFALWLSKEHPDIFVSIARRTMPQLSGLGDISDVFSAIGSGFSSAVSSVGDFVSNPQNIASLSTVATAYFKSQTPQPQLANAQNSVFQTQLQRAQYGSLPANVTYSQNAAGQMIPMYNGQPITQAQLAALQPSFLQKYGLWFLIGGAGIAAVLILRS